MVEIVRAGVPKDRPLIVGTGRESTRGAINASKRVFLSSTIVDGRFVLRACILSFRTHRDRIEEAAAIIREAARALQA